MPHLFEAVELPKIFFKIKRASLWKYVSSAVHFLNIFLVQREPQKKTLYQTYLPPSNTQKMKFNSSLFVSLVTLAKMVVADSDNFSLMSTSNVGSKETIFLIDDKAGLVLTTGGNSLTETAVVTDAGNLKFSDGKYAVVKSDGSVTDGDSSAAASGFAIANGLLTYNGSSDFYAMANGGNYTLSTKESDGAVSFQFTPRNKKTDDTADDFTPGKGTVKKSTSTIPTTTGAAVSSATISIQSENMAPRAITGAGFGAFAAIAGFLL